MTRVPLERLRPTCNPLRQVDERSVEFEELKDSIEACGILQPILVRPQPPQLAGGTACDPNTCDELFEVVDGMHRYRAAVLLGLPEVPCVVQELTDDAVLRLQVECNAHRLETTPVDYARRLRAILRRHPQLTQAELGRMLHKSAAWVRNTLGLLRLVAPVAKCVERGEVPLKSAYLLAQLCPTTQKEFLKDAMFRTSAEFDALIRPVLVNQRSDDVAPLIDTFNPVAHLRSLKQITAEIADPAQAPAVLAAEGVDHILDAFLVALKWATHTDILSIRKYEHEYRSRQSARQL